jgi:hypothetical protein
MKADHTSHALKFALPAIIALIGSVEAAAQTRTKSAVPSDASLAPVRAKIAQKCTYDSGKYFAAGTPNIAGRCECYAAGLSKLLSTEEIRYIFNYDKIPDISKDQNAKIQNACLGGGPQPAGKARPQKKS